MPITLPQAQIDVLMQTAEQGRDISVDLAEQKVVCGNEVFHFEIDAFRKHCLMNGLDDIGLTLEKENMISAFEERRKLEKPWL